jgi:hypothetical protein
MIEVPFKDFDDTFNKLIAEKKPCKNAAPFWPEIVERASNKNMKVYVFLIGSR